MNAQLKPIYEALTEVFTEEPPTRPTYNNKDGYSWSDCQDLIKQIKTLIPAKQLEKLSFLQANEACFKKFLNISFQHVLYLYGNVLATSSFENYTSMMNNEDFMEHFSKDDGDEFIKKAVERAKVFWSYQCLVKSDPYRDWIGDIYMEMVAQHVKNKHNNNAFYPTPFDLADLCAKIQVATSKERFEKEEIIRMVEICCGTAGMSMRNLNQLKKDGLLHKVFLRLTDIDETMVKIAAIQCLSIMFCEETIFGLQIIQQNDITEEVYDVAFSNVGLAVHKTHTLKEEAPWTPPNRSTMQRKPDASPTL